MILNPLRIIGGFFLPRKNNKVRKMDNLRT